MALAHKGIEYEYRAVNIIQDEQRDDSYLKINPIGQVPSLFIDDVTLTQSLAIIEYLDETRPEKPLLPRDPVKKAQVRRIAEIINSGIQPLQNLPVIGRIAEITGKDSEKAVWAKYWINRGFQALESVLSQTAGKFAVGNEMTMADICVIIQIFNARRFGVDLTQFPIITRLETECGKLEAFQKAHPTKQPDCPPAEARL